VHAENSRGRRAVSVGMSERFCNNLSPGTVDRVAIREGLGRVSSVGGGNAQR
jgi:hypothetical protein